MQILWYSTSYPVEPDLITEETRYGDNLGCGNVEGVFSDDGRRTEVTNKHIWRKCRGSRLVILLTLQLI